MLFLMMIARCLELVKHFKERGSVNASIKRRGLSRVVNRSGPSISSDVDLRVKDETFLWSIWVPIDEFSEIGKSVKSLFTQLFSKIFITKFPNKIFFAKIPKWFNRSF